MGVCACVRLSVCLCLSHILSGRVCKMIVSILRLSVCLSVRLSVPFARCCNVWWLCCRAPSGHEILIEWHVLGTSSTAFSSKCEQSHVETRGLTINTDLCLCKSWFIQFLQLFSYRPNNELLLQTPPRVYFLHEEWSFAGAWTVLPIIAR